MFLFTNYILQDYSVHPVSFSSCLHRVLYSKTKYIINLKLHTFKRKSNKVNRTNKTPYKRVEIEYINWNSQFAKYFFFNNPLKL